MSTYRRTGVVGPKFENIHQVEAYLSKSFWTIEDLLPRYDITKENIPSEETVKSLLKLSGLPMQNLKDMQLKLANQLSFINTLHNLPVDETIDANHARIMIRHPKPLSFNDIEMATSKEMQKDESLGEVSGSWDTVECSKIHENGFFVVREGLIRNRD